MHSLIGWPNAPSLSIDKTRELELHGIDAIRGLLANSTDGYSGTGRKTQFTLGNGITVDRGEMQDWLKWKVAKDAWWIKAGAMAAFAAAIFSLLALFK